MQDKKKSKGSGRKLSARNLKNEVFKLLKRNARKKLNAKQIIRKLKISNSPDAVQHALEGLTEEGKLFSFGDKLYRLDRNIAAGSGPVITKEHQGVVDITRSGAGYIIVDSLENDVYVPAKFLGGAMNGDKVTVAVSAARGRRKPEGKITKVLERASEFFIGTISIGPKYATGLVEIGGREFEIYIELENLLEAEDGEKAVIKITKWPTRTVKNMFGRVTTVLGAAGSNNIEMNAILINNGFNIDFPEDVVAESEALNDDLDDAEITRRRDMRGITTFTIDPDTAKDFDDALSVQKLENGDIEIGVHIADVTHYVRPNTALDKEAFKRSTSVYLVDRVCPMLPERLSNELCSLRPNEDKCTFSAVFTFNEAHKVTSRWFGKTLIHSDRRFAYEEAQEILEAGEGELHGELLLLNTIAKKLRKKKFKNGAIAFEGEEVKFRLDEDGVPVEAYVKERKDAHLLIEDFMLLANREVATYMVKKSKGVEIPYVYRVHDLPDPDRVADFGKFAAELGFKMTLDTPRQIADSFNGLAKAARENDSLRLLEPIAIRTMAKAIYTTENIGHYGLGFENYSHFTSPIRRYADVLAHRLLFKNLGDKTHRENKEDLEARCKHISAQERKAMTAERESIKYKQVEFISKHIGEEMEGHISGMIDRGLFIELAGSKAEGLIGFDKLNDAYDIDESRLKAIGRRSKKVYKMGDKVRVRILDTDMTKRQIEMELMED